MPTREPIPGGLYGLYINTPGPKPCRETFQSRYYRQHRPIDKCFSPARKRKQDLGLKKIRDKHTYPKVSWTTFNSRYYKNGGSGMSAEMMECCFASKDEYISKRATILTNTESNNSILRYRLHTMS